MSVGKTIKLFLADGTAGGLITAEILNWTGHVVSAPRSNLSELIDRPEMSRTGIYFLLGDDPESFGGTLAYIGEADEVGRRLYQHGRVEEKGGKVVRRYDPKIMKTLTAIDLDQPLPSLWPQFVGLKRVPLLVVRGSRSDLLSRETVEKMHVEHPTMRSTVVADQGHAPDLGSAGLPERIATFINRVETPDEATASPAA